MAARRLLNCSSTIGRMEILSGISSTAVRNLMALQYESLTHPVLLAPLFDAEGRLVFFIGGQIDASTAIQCNADIIQMLSASVRSASDTTTDQCEAHQTKPSTPSSRSTREARRRILESKEQKKSCVQENSGMEKAVLRRMEGQEWHKQVAEFYNAYSKVI
jgi:hypothetical protein